MTHPHEDKRRKCAKCNGTGFYQYSTEGTHHSKICEDCCKHEGTPWHSDGKFWCKSGCGIEMPAPTDKNTWEEEFAEKFGYELGGDAYFVAPNVEKAIVSFISNLLVSEKELHKMQLEDERKAGEFEGRTEAINQIKKIAKTMLGCDSIVHKGQKYILVGDEKVVHEALLTDLLTSLDTMEI